MIVRDGGAFAFLADRHVVHEHARWNEQPINRKGMIGRDQEVATRHSVTEGTRQNAHGVSHPFISVTCQIKTTKADPLHRPRGAGCHADEIAFVQGFDGDRSFRRVDSRARGEAGEGDVVAVRHVEIMIIVSAIPERKGFSTIGRGGDRQHTTGQWAEQPFVLSPTDTCNDLLIQLDGIAGLPSVYGIEQAYAEVGIYDEPSDRPTGVVEGDRTEQSNIEP
jgi:hypothetical protein